MSKDPAFLFYPGDYLRDTQTLSEKSQVAYDRIMCEHMRNICISQQQLKFFTKRLTDEEIEELMFTLTETKGGYQIEWVAESILKRRKYSESRSKNRKGKKKTHDEDMKSYDNHMENENENVIKNKKVLSAFEKNCLEAKEKLKIPDNVFDDFMEHWTGKDADTGLFMWQSTKNGFNIESRMKNWKKNSDENIEHVNPYL